MANLFLSQPQQYTPAYNPCIFVANSTNFAQPNHKYVFDIYINGVKVARVKKTQDTGTNALIDVSPIVRDYISTNFDAAPDISKAFRTNTNSFVELQVKLGEEYGTPPAVQASFTNSALKYVWNASLKKVDYSTYVFTDYIFDNVTPKPFLTRSPLVQDIRTNDNAWLFAGVSSTALTGMALSVQYSGGADLFNISNQYAGAGGNDFRFVRFPSGVVNINRIPVGFVTGKGTTIVSPNNYIKAGALYYELYLWDNPAGIAPIKSEIRRYNIVDTPCKYTPKRLHWLNELGGFDSLSFDLMSTKQVSVQRGFYERVEGLYDADSGTYSHRTDYAGNVQNKTQVKTKEVLNSDWISQEYSTWLQGLVTSPVVYLQINNLGLGYDYIRVNVDNSTYDIKKRVNDKLISLEISIEHSLVDYRQNA